MSVVPQQVVHLVRALQLSAVACMQPVQAIYDGVLIRGAELVVRDVPEHPFDEIRRCQTFLDDALFDHAVAHVLEDADHWLEI